MSAEWLSVSQPQDKWSERRNVRRGAYVLAFVWNWAEVGFRNKSNGAFYTFFFFFEFQPELAVSADTVDLGPNRPDFGQIGPSRSRVGSRWRELAKSTWNPHGTTRRDTADCAGSSVLCASPRPAVSDAGAAPPVPHPCFIGIPSLLYIYTTLQMKCSYFKGYMCVILWVCIDGDEILWYVYCAFNALKQENGICYLCFSVNFVLILFWWWGLFKLLMMLYVARVRFGIRVRVRDSAIFEKGGCFIA